MSKWFFLHFFLLLLVYKNVKEKFQLTSFLSLLNNYCYIKTNHRFQDMLEKKNKTKIGQMLKEFSQLFLSITPKKLEKATIRVVTDIGIFLDCTWLLDITKRSIIRYVFSHLVTWPSVAVGFLSRLKFTISLRVTVTTFRVLSIAIKTHLNYVLSSVSLRHAYVWYLRS